MKKEKISPERWFNMSEKERKRIYSSWDIYKGEGAEILKVVLDRFKKDYSDKNAILKIYSGLYHGGDWVIGVTVRWDSKEKVKLPDSYYGITVKILYDKAPSHELVKIAERQFKVWYKSVRKNKEFQCAIERNDFLKTLPKEKLYEYLWSMNGMSEYYNPFKRKNL